MCPVHVSRQKYSILFTSRPEQGTRIKPIVPQKYEMQFNLVYLNQTKPRKFALTRHSQYICDRTICKLQHANRPSIFHEKPNGSLHSSIPIQVFSQYRRAHYPHLKSEAMRKFIFAAAFLLETGTGTASATQFRVVCCDGTVHYIQGIGLTAYFKSHRDWEEVMLYADFIVQKECENNGNCYKSVEELPSNLPLSYPNSDTIKSECVSLLPAIRDGQTYSTV